MVNDVKNTNRIIVASAEESHIEKQQAAVNIDEPVISINEVTTMTEPSQEPVLEPDGELEKPDPSETGRNAKSTQVLTVGNYYADRVLTPGNSEAIMRNRLEQATQAYLNSRSETAERRQALKAEQQEALEELQRFQAALQASQPKLQLIIPKTMPALQIRGSAIHDPSRPVHESAYAFVSAFEVQLRIHGLDFDSNWERLFWLCLDNNQVSWCRRELADKNLTWRQATHAIHKKYGIPYHTFHKRRELFNAHLGKDEPIRQYTERWVELAHQAGCINDPDIAYDFLCSLPITIREKVLPALAYNWGTQLPSEITKVTQLVIATIGESAGDCQDQKEHDTRKRCTEHEPTSSIHSRRRRRLNSGQRKYGDCPVHTRSAHSAKECRALQRLHESLQHDSS